MKRDNIRQQTDFPSHGNQLFIQELYLRSRNDSFIYE